MKTWEKRKLQNWVRDKSGRYYAKACADGKEFWKALKTFSFLVAEARAAQFFAPVVPRCSLIGSTGSKSEPARREARVLWAKTAPGRSLMGIWLQSPPRLGPVACILRRINAARPTVYGRLGFSHRTGTCSLFAAAIKFASCVASRSFKSLATRRYSAS